MKTFRKQLHLTQRELAALIGVSNSAIALHEKGLRNLPAKAVLKLAQMQQQLQQAQRRQIAPGLKLQSRQQVHLLKVEKVLNAHARKAAADALRISLLLSTMQDRYQLLLQKLDFIYGLMETATPATRQMSLLENMELTVLDALDHCGPARQQVAAYRLATLKARQQAAITRQTVIKQISAPVKGS